MHQITGFRFFTKNNGNKYVVYSTLYSHGRYASLHDCTGLTDQQAMGKFIVEHNHEVDRLLKEKQANEKQSLILK
jgi:hypothetical protein